MNERSIPTLDFYIAEDLGDQFRPAFRIEGHSPGSWQSRPEFRVVMAARSGSDKEAPWTKNAVALGNGEPWIGQVI
ncbi:MAG: hypothetical protein L0177_12965 [Chloroflexi bacterium]|nr:hypothetical protein [Chloroflexota bacterium]